MGWIQPVFLLVRKGAADPLDCQKGCAGDDRIRRDNKMGDLQASVQRGLW